MINSNSNALYHLNLVCGSSQIGKTFTIRNILARSGQASDEFDLYYWNHNFAFGSEKTEIDNNYLKLLIKRAIGVENLKWEVVKQKLKDIHEKITEKPGNCAIFIIHLDEYHRLIFPTSMKRPVNSKSNAYKIMEQTDQLLKNDSLAPNFKFFPICSGLDAYGMSHVTDDDPFVSRTPPQTWNIPRFTLEESIDFFQKLLNYCVQNSSSKIPITVPETFKEIFKLFQGHPG